MIAVFKREFKAYFTGTLGWVWIAVFLFFSAMFFGAIYMNGSPTVEAVVSAMSIIVTFATPFITMRLLSEDRRQKVDQALLTAPVSVTSIVMGKFLAAMALFALGFSFTLIYQLIVAFYVPLNWLIYFYSLFGMLLLGAVMIAIGMFISSLTESSVVAAALTFAVFLLDMLIGSYASAVDSTWLTNITQAIAFIERFNNFTTGVFNVVDVVYLASIAALFVFLTTRMVERRRWA